MLETVLKRFEEPDEVRTFEKGKFELVRIGGMTIGRATYQPGWKWSLHVGPLVGASRCNVRHVGLVVSGCATAAMEDGTIHELSPGTLFHIPPGPPGHDSWVVGDVPYVSLHFLGTEQLRQQITHSLTKSPCRLPEAQRLFTFPQLFLNYSHSNSFRSFHFRDSSFPRISSFEYWLHSY